MCGEAMNRKELFEKYFKSLMLSMVMDRVQNVRMVLAKVLRHHFLNQINGAFVFDLEVNDAVRILKSD
jgi:nitrogen regulatory protein PII